MTYKEFQKCVLSSENGHTIDIFVDEESSTFVKINEKEKNKMENNEKIERLLNMWMSLNAKKLNKKQEEEIEKILNRDIVAIELSDKLEEIEKILDEFIEKHPEIPVNFNVTGSKPQDVITDDSKKKIEKIEEKYDNLRVELKHIANEVGAAISICESEESLRKILKAYGIIDTNGKIKVK